MKKTRLFRITASFAFTSWLTESGLLLLFLCCGTDVGEWAQVGHWTHVGCRAYIDRRTHIRCRTYICRRAYVGHGFSLGAVRLLYIERPFVEFLLDYAQGFAEALEVDHFALPEETQRIYDVRVVRHVDESFVCRPGFLFRREVFDEVGYRIALDADIRCGERHAVPVNGIDAPVVIGIVSAESFLLKDLRGNSLRELVYDSACYFQMGKLLSTTRLSKYHKNSLSIIGLCGPSVMI